MASRCAKELKNLLTHNLKAAGSNPAPAPKITHVTNLSASIVVHSAFYRFALVSLAASAALTTSVLIALIGDIALRARKALLWTTGLAIPDRCLERLISRNAVFAR